MSSRKAGTIPLAKIPFLVLDFAQRNTYSFNTNAVDRLACYLLIGVILDSLQESHALWGGQLVNNGFQKHFLWHIPKQQPPFPLVIQAILHLFQHPLASKFLAGSPADLPTTTDAVR